MNMIRKKLMIIKKLIEVKRGKAETKMIYTANPEVLFTPIKSYSLRTWFNASAVNKVKK